MDSATTTVNGRSASFPIDPLFLERWSPRAFTGEAIDEVELLTMFEAARWAPSSHNSQPWRFLYARRFTPHWERFLGLLSEYNQMWAHSASALVVIVSNTLMLRPGAAVPIPSPTHSFDAGAAWAMLALQAARSGWQAHGMAGFDKERALLDLNVPEGYAAEVAIAVGRVGDPSTLPERLQVREFPSHRYSLEELVMEGGFPA
ncbi:MAG: nitroreductase family protein [Acetobacteraceae bacterium]